MKKIDIRNKLIEIRESKGLSKRTVSEMTGIPYTTYIKYESGERKDISMDAIVKLAKFYGVTTDYLLGLDSPPNPFADLNLPPESEKEVLEKYMSFPPEIRACLLDALRKLGAAADGNTTEPEPEPPKELAPKSNVKAQDTNVTAKISELERQNQELLARIEAIEEEDMEAEKEKLLKASEEKAF